MYTVLFIIGIIVFMLFIYSLCTIAGKSDEIADKLTEEYFKEKELMDKKTRNTSDR